MENELKYYRLQTYQSGTRENQNSFCRLCTRETDFVLKRQTLCIKETDVVLKRQILY